MKRHMTIYQEKLLVAALAGFIVVGFAAFAVNPGGLGSVFGTHATHQTADPARLG